MGLGICEGIETGLRILLDGWSPIWCGGNDGGIERFPVLAGIDSLTIFPDDDQAGTNAANKCRAQWIAACREARTACTKDAFDGI